MKFIHTFIVFGALIFSKVLCFKDVNFYCDVLDEEKNQINLKHFVDQLTDIDYSYGIRTYYSLSNQFISERQDWKIIKYDFETEEDINNFWLQKLMKRDLDKADYFEKYFLKYCASFQYEDSYYSIYQQSTVTFDVLKRQEGFQSLSFYQKMKMSMKVAKILDQMNTVRYELCYLDNSMIALVDPKFTFTYDDENIRIKTVALRSIKNNTPCKKFSNQFAAPEFEWSQKELNEFVEENPEKLSIYSFGVVLLTLFANKKILRNGVSSLAVREFLQQYRKSNDLDLNAFLSSAFEQSYKYVDEDQNFHAFDSQIITGKKMINLVSYRYQYSIEILRQLIMSMLSKDPSKRPSSREVEYTLIIVAGNFVQNKSQYFQFAEKPLWQFFDRNLQLHFLDDSYYSNKYKLIMPQKIKGTEKYSQETMFVEKAENELLNIVKEMDKKRNEVTQELEENQTSNFNENFNFVQMENLRKIQINIVDQTNRKNLLEQAFRYQSIFNLEEDYSITKTNQIKQEDKEYLQKLEEELTNFENTQEKIDQQAPKKALTQILEDSNEKKDNMNISNFSIPGII